MIAFMTEITATLISAVVGGLAGLGAVRFARLQVTISTASVAADWLRDLREWASEAIDALAEAEDALRSSPESAAVIGRDVSCRHRLSALIDRGRLLIPNEIHDDYGKHKLPAFQGYRPVALDALVASVRVLKGTADLHAFPTSSDALYALRREFISAIQGILDPRSSNKLVAAILVRAYDRDEDSTLGGLLPDPENIPGGATRLMRRASLRFERDRKKEQLEPPRDCRRLPIVRGWEHGETDEVFS